MKIKHTFTHDDGRVSTRNSTGRIYTHVIVGCPDLAALRIQAQSPAVAKMHKDNWDYMLTQEKYKAEVRKYDGQAAYVAACIEAGLDRINKRGLGDAGEEEVLQWSMSHANAVKAIGTWSKHYVNIAVREVD